MKQPSARLIIAIMALAIVIVAATVIYAMTASNSANSATNKPDLLDWFGCVVDSNSTPMGNVTVTLCLMTPTGEAYNVSVRTQTEAPYPGSYAFDGVPVRDDVTYAYAIADSGDLGGGVHAYGRTNNVEINRSRITPGFIVLHIPGSDTSTPPGDSSAGRIVQGWFGSVCDSSGKALGGITVTLHLMSPNGEVTTYITQSMSAGPYPGSYVFDNILLPDGVTYAYVTAESGDPGDGVSRSARSGNYTFNQSRISSGFLVL